LPNAPAAVAQTEDKWISPHDREDKIKFVRFATKRKKQQLSNQLSYAQYAVKNFLQHTQNTSECLKCKAKVAWHLFCDEPIQQWRKKVGRRFWHTASRRIYINARGQRPTPGDVTQDNGAHWRLVGLGVC